jgi:hypothetical protein
LLDTFSLCEPVSTSLGNAIGRRPPRRLGRPRCSIPRSGLRLSFVELRAIGRHFAFPRPLLLKLRRQAQQRRFFAKPCREHHAKGQSGAIPGQRHRHCGLTRHIDHRGCRHRAPQDRRDMRQILCHGVEFAYSQRRQAERRAQEHIAACEKSREPTRDLEGAELRGYIVAFAFWALWALARVSVSKSRSVMARPKRCSANRTLSAVLAATMVDITAPGSAASAGARSST